MNEEKNKFKNELVLFLCTDLLIVIIGIIARNIVSKSEWYWILCPLILFFTIGDLQACNECYKAKWKIHSDIKELCPVNLHLINNRDDSFFEIRDTILNLHAYPYIHKCHRMTLRVLNSILIELMLVCFIYHYTDVQNAHVSLILFYLMIVISLVYCICLISLIREYDKSVKQMLYNNLICLDNILCGNITNTTTAYYLDEENFYNLPFGVITSIIATIIIDIIIS